MGRHNQTTHAQDIRMARMHFVEGLSYSAIASFYNIGSKNTIGYRLKQLSKDYPEFIEDLREIKKYQESLPVVLTPEQQLDKELAEGIGKDLDDKLAEQDLIHKLESKLKHILDIPEEEIRAMKAKDRLRLAPELVKTLRLLQDKSTENVKKVNLIGAIGIATARRRPDGAGR